MEFPRGKTPWQRLFRNPTSRSNKAMVPKLNFTAKNLKNNGFVRPQKNTNSLSNVRTSVYEQNFLRRILTMVENSFIKTKVNPEKIINFTAYQEVLKNPNTTPEESILIYNELIAIFVILVLYVFAIAIKHHKTGTVQYNKANVRSKLRINDKVNLDFKPYMDNISRSMKVAVGSTALFVTMAAYTSVLMVSGAFIPFISGVAGIAPVVLSIVAGVRVYLDNKVMRTDLLGLFKTLHSTMFDENNTVPISQVKDSLKYWGLTKAQVDYLFTTNINKNNNYVNTVSSCAICSEEYSQSPEKPTKILNPCRHMFHEECINASLIQKSICPRCNQPVNDGHTDEYLVFISKFIDLYKMNPEDLAPNLPLKLPSNKSITEVVNMNGTSSNLGSSDPPGTPDGTGPPDGVLTLPGEVPRRGGYRRRLTRRNKR